MVLEPHSIKLITIKPDLNNNIKINERFRQHLLWLWNAQSKLIRAWPGDERLLWLPIPREWIWWAIKINKLIIFQQTYTKLLRW